MKGYTKADVQFHTEGYGRRSSPAVNVRAFDWPRFGEWEEKFPELNEESLTQLADWCFESQQEGFWEMVADSEELSYYFPKRDVKAYSEGRSAGWLIVKGLPDLEQWDAILLNYWARFEKAMKEEVKYLCSWESLSELIEANDWAERLADRQAREEGTGLYDESETAAV